MDADSALITRVAAHYYRYARAVDDGDVMAIDKLVADDVCVVRATDGFTGREEVLSLYRAHRDAPTLFTQHVITNVQASTEADGSIAACAYVTVTMVDGDGGVRLLLGRYTDRLSDVDGRLLLTHKRVDVLRELRLDASAHTFAGVLVPAARLLD